MHFAVRSHCAGLTGSPPWMRFRISFVTCLATFGCRSADEGVFVVPATRHLGVIDPAVTEHAEAFFVLHNRSSERVRIKETMTGCACTDLTPSSYVIPPGGECELRMRIKTDGLRGHRSIASLVRTDSPEYPSFHLAVVGDFRSGKGISPISISLPNATPGEVIDREVPLPVAGVAVDAISMQNENELRVGFVNATAAEESSRLHISGFAPEEVGMREWLGTIMFSDVEESTELRIACTVVERVTGPAAMNLGLMRPSKSVFESFELVDNRGSPIRAVELEAGHQGSFSIAKISIGGPKARVFIRYDVPETRGFVDRDVRLKVDSTDGSSHTVRIPVVGRILEPDGDSLAQ